MIYRIALFASLFLLTIFSFGQSGMSLKNFERDVLDYTPEQRVSDKAYSYGMMILSETKKATKNDPQNFNLADYFNVLSAFLTLSESEENVDAAFEKFVQADGSCEYIIAFRDKFLENEKYVPVRSKYVRELERCSLPSGNGKPKIGSINEFGGNDELQQAIRVIKEKDQRYRKIGEGSGQKQRELDLQNQAEIDKLYDQYGEYIGRTKVGKELEDVMWLVVQHSNMDMMKRYLAVIHRAVESNELSPTPLKMLLDRLYGVAEGYQFFGSQGSAIPIAQGLQRQSILEKYDLE
jgi:hypothetical protein